jgi:putative aldouronate transport system permease protein
MKAATRPIWMDKPSPLTTALKCVTLVIVCLLVLVPFLAVISTSLADQKTLTEAGGFLLFPKDPSFDSYKAVLAGGVVTRALLVSIAITVVGTFLSLAATTGLAYSLSRPGSLLHRPILFVVLGSLLFGAGLIPNYLVVKSLGLLDSYWSLILPVLVNGFNVIVMRAFFMELPEELFESARIDGASEFRVLTRIVLPLSKAVMAVIGLFYAVGYWNNFFQALIYINTPEKWPLQLVLRTFVVNQAALGTDQLAVGGEALPPQQSIQMAILVISIVPILLVYPFLQRHFAKGVLVGAVKG